MRNKLRLFKICIIMYTLHKPMAQSIRIILYLFTSTLVIPLVFLQFGIYRENNNEGLLVMSAITLLSLYFLFLLFKINVTKWKQINSHSLSIQGIRNNAIIALMLLGFFYLLTRITLINWSSDIALGNVNIFLLFLTVSVLGPFEEEFFYRGIVQNYFSQKLPIPYAILLTTLVFVLSHFSFSIQILVTGLLFGYIYQKNGNIWYSIVLHGILNACPLIFTYVLK